MTLSESDLLRWSKRGSIAGARRTRAAILRALSGLNARGRKHRVFLQGSYRNATNTPGKSDVDVVVLLDVEPEDNLGSKGSWFTHRPLYARVAPALRKHFFGSGVEVRRKCIRLAANSGRLEADVVVGIPYLHYLDGDDDDPVPGIRLYTGLLGRTIVNFPERHYRNGAAKNRETETRFRAAVRMFKAARWHVEARSWWIERPHVTSYHLESLLYNAPNTCFRRSLRDTYAHTIDWLAGELDRDPNGEAFVCQNSVHALFGQDDVQWQSGSARHLLALLDRLREEGA